jgi:hypothetical protein
MDFRAIAACSLLEPQPKFVPPHYAAGDECFCKVRVCAFKAMGRNGLRVYQFQIPPGKNLVCVYIIPENIGFSRYNGLHHKYLLGSAIHPSRAEAATVAGDAR